MFYLIGALIIGAIGGWLARGGADAHIQTRELRERTERTRALLFPRLGREQMLRDLRGDGANRDGMWRSRRRRDNEARNRRRS